MVCNNNLSARAHAFLLQLLAIHEWGDGKGRGSARSMAGYLQGEQGEGPRGKAAEGLGGVWPSKDCRKSKATRGADTLQKRNRGQGA